jgi:phospholipid/cholesterol/gamma-HCH transport system substrate-binding protein
MEPRVHYVVVGLFVLLLGSAAIGISLWLAFGDVAYATRTFRIYMNESVAGLFVDAPVRYRGVHVGRVRNLALVPENPEHVQITVDIDAGVSIKEGTVAKLNVQGLTGIAAIELSGGRADAPDIQARPGEPYPVIPAVPSLFSRVDASLSELIGNLNMVAQDLHDLLTPQTREHVLNILNNVDALAATAAEQRTALATGIEAFSAFSRDTAAASARLPQLLTRVEGAVDSIQAVVEDIGLATRAVQEQVHAGGDSLRTLGGRTLPEIESLLSEMRQLTSSFQRLSDRLEDDPRAVLYGPQLDAPGPGE